MKNSQALNISGELPVGVVWQGERHTSFTLRPAVMSDNFYAVATLGVGVSDAAMDENQISADSLQRNFAMLSQQIVTLGGIPKEVLTYHFLAENMPPDDFPVLWQAAVSLKKKWQDLPLFSKDGPPLNPFFGSGAESAAAS